MDRQEILRLLNDSKQEEPMFSIAEFKDRDLLDIDTADRMGEDRRSVGYGENIATVYLREISKVPLLSREREIQLGKRIRLGKQRIRGTLLRCRGVLKDNGFEEEKNKPGDLAYRLEEFSMTAAQRLEKHPGSEKNGLRHCLGELKKAEADVKAAKAELIQSNLRLVVTIAKAFVNRGLYLSDLVQEGNLGLIKAVSKYDHRKGTKFSTYAFWWIRQAITRALTERSKIIRVPVHVWKRRRKVDKVASQLMTELSRDPLPEEVAQRAGISQEHVREVKDLMLEPVSLEAPLGEDGDRLVDHIGSEENMSVDDNSLRKMDLAKKTKDLLSSLRPREERVLRLRFGIGEPKSHTLKEIGRQLNISHEMVRRIERRALNRLKANNASEAVGDIW